MSPRLPAKSRRRESSASEPTLGQLDGLEGTYAVGWAQGNGTAPCTITIAAGDLVVAQGTASLQRVDTQNRSWTRGDCAFRVPVPSFQHQAELRVLADGVEIAGSPVTVGAGLFDGRMWLSQGAVAGWVTERTGGFRPPCVTIRDQNERVVMRTESKLDLRHADQHFTPARFAGELDQQCFGRSELRLSAYADDCKFAEATCDLSLVGILEAVSEEGCTGWLVSPGAPERTFEIEVLCNGQPIRRFVTNLPRADLLKNHPGGMSPGFDRSFALPEAEEGRAVTISFQLAGSDVELFEGPYVLASREEAVAAARRMSRLALGGGGLTVAERAVLGEAVGDYLAKVRASEKTVFKKRTFAPPDMLARHKVNIVIPVYRDTATTRICIEAVLACRLDHDDTVIIVDDCSPEPQMQALLESFEQAPNVHVLRNAANLGFIKSVNRALSFCGDGDVLMLNSDTRMFPGGLEELQKVAHSSPDIGTVTAMSNNATIFSYPHQRHTRDRLEDIGWEALAALTLEQNRGRAIDVPTGHGFCLYVRGDVLRRVGRLDESFGRGYGEENDFCARAADLGYRNVAAPGAFVEHRESHSFAQEKEELLAQNLRLLHGRFPEYQVTILESERRDDLRSARWGLDGARLRRASEAGTGFALVVHHDLGGGTNRAISEIEKAAGYGGAVKMTLTCRADGWRELVCLAPFVRAIFAPDEGADLLDLLASADIVLVVVHHVLGFSAEFIDGFREWLPGRHSIFHVHDYYSLCPRVTMIDAVGQFCDVAAAPVCDRCIALDGRHGSSRLTDMTTAEHRALFERFLLAFTHVVAPSHAAAAYVRREFPRVSVEVIPHPELSAGFPPQARRGTDDEIVLLGALGAHKGSGTLLDIARLALLTRPHLRFRVIGYTDRDEELRDLGNVDITGSYSAASLPHMAAHTQGRLALFLSGWPETYSYTLTEAATLGFVPLVPDIGAPAERVRAAGFGAVFGFPIVPAEVLALIDSIAGKTTVPWKKGAGPGAFAPLAASIRQTRTLYLSGKR